MQTVQQHEIDAQIETAMQTKKRYGYTQTAAPEKFRVRFPTSPILAIQSWCGCVPMLRAMC